MIINIAIEGERLTDRLDTYGRHSSTHPPPLPYELHGIVRQKYNYGIQKLNFQHWGKEEVQTVHTFSTGGSTRWERNVMRTYQVSGKVGWSRKRSPRAQRATFAIKNNVDLERPAKAEIQYSRES